MLSEYIKINTHTINLKKDKQPPYELIYSLGLVELEILKIYIQTNLDNIFIQPFKFPAGAFILFDQKFNRSFWLCINYQGFSNLIIKNWYLLLLIGEFFD